MDVARRHKILGSETTSGVPKTTAWSDDLQGGIPRLSIMFVLTALIYYSEKRPQRERLKACCTKETQVARSPLSDVTQDTFNSLSNKL